MKIPFEIIKPADHLSKKMESDERLRKYFKEIKGLTEFKARIYVETKIETDKFDALKNVLMTLQWDNGKFIKIKFNYNYNYRASAVELYIINFSVINKKISNGMDVALNKEPSSKIEFMNIIENLKRANGFIQTYNSSAEILEAINLYKNISNDLNKNSEDSFRIKDFAKHSVYSVDKNGLKGMKIDSFSANKNTFVYSDDSTRVPSESLNDNLLILWELKTPQKIPADIHKSLSSIMKDSGDLYYSLIPDDNNPVSSIRLIDYKIKRNKSGESILYLITDDKTIADHAFFCIFDRLRYKKKNTMLSIVEDIEKNRINNNDVFQYLFNKGEFKNISNISNWDENIELANDITSELFDNQKIAFSQAIDNFPLSFIQGPPGTGKTHIITKICQYYNSLGMKVLLSSQTNVAVENILENLWNDNDFPYISVKADFKDSSYSSINIDNLINNKIKNMLDIDTDLPMEMINTSQFIDKSNIIASTTTSSAINHRKWNNFVNEFDILIIDEISKSSVPELIRYIANARKVILVGDQKQLAPLDEIDSRDKVWQKYTEMDKRIIEEYISSSIFDNLYENMEKNKRAVMLDVNNRSLPSILNIYSKFYNDKLIPNRNDSDSRIIWKENSWKWNPFSFISMNGATEIKDNNKSRYNIQEASEIENILKQLSTSIENVSELSVGIITYYGAQVREIKSRVSIQKYSKVFKGNIKVDTVDAFQGDQADIIILSTVRADKTATPGFIDNFRRVNVSISRAKDLLIMLGNDYILRDIIMQVNDKKLPFFDEMLDTIEDYDDKDIFEGYQKSITRRVVS